MNTKFISFLFTIPNEFFSDAVEVTVPYEINVRYAFHYNKKVDVEAYYIKPGMAKHIVNWDGLEEQIQAAAENNSKSYLAPDEYRTGKMRPEGLNPYDDIHEQWEQEIQELERENW